MKPEVSRTFVRAGICNQLPEMLAGNLLRTTSDSARQRKFGLRSAFGHSRRERHSDGQYGTQRAAHGFLSHTSHQQSRETGSAMSAHHYQVDAGITHGAQNLSRWIAFNESAFDRADIGRNRQPT